MQKYNIIANLIRVIKHLYEKATTAVFFNGSIGDWFRTTVGVQQGCQLSFTVFNIFLEVTITDSLGHHEGIVSTEGRTITNFRFANDIDGLDRDEVEQAKLLERLDKASTSYGMVPRSSRQSNHIKT